MKKVRTYITVGRHVLSEIHTAIWLLGILGIPTSSAVQFLLSLPELSYLPFLLLAQTVIWGLITVFAVGYVGYHAQRIDASSKQIATPSGIGGVGGSGTIILETVVERIRVCVFSRLDYNQRLGCRLFTAKSNG